MRRKCYMALPLMIASAFCAIPVAAQNTEKVTAFSKLDVDVTGGTTGLGVELSTPLNRSISVRAGYSFMPHFTYDMDFYVSVGESTDPAVSNSRFQKMATALKNITGYEVDNKVTMVGEPKMWNASLLVDFKPLHNKSWHITTGFYWGSSRIGYAENSKGDMSSLFAIGMYNHLYEYAKADEPLYTIDGTDVYLPTSVEDKMVEYGRMGVHVGTYKHDIVDADGNVVHAKGTAYNMEPDNNCMVSAKMLVNAFKPYVGVGYDGRLGKAYGNWKIGFDAGVAFWGGTPQIITHDGTDLVNDVTDLRQHVDHYVKLIKKVKALPVINLKITKTLFKTKK